MEESTVRELIRACDVIQLASRDARRYLPVIGGWHASNRVACLRTTNQRSSKRRSERFLNKVRHVGAAVPGQVSMNEMNAVLIRGRLLSIMVVFLTEMFADWTNTCVGRTRT